MTKIKTTVSVIIPAYNADKYLEKCLLSLTKQTFKDFEIIVVDDASQDFTFQIAQKYAKAIKNEKNMGEGASRNKGAHVAHGEILAHTDADVILPETWLEKIVNNLKSKGIKAVAGGYCGSVGNSFIERFSYLELAFRRKDFAGYVNTAVSNNFACYRDVFFECGMFPEKFKCEDLRFSYEISKKYPIFWDKENGVFHHFRPFLKAYLKQQYYFAKDTVWTYYCYPVMILKKTHQGKGIYGEVILMFFVLVGTFVFPVITPIFLSLILILNYNFLIFLKRQGLHIVLSSALILLRNVICVIGIFAGIGMCLKYGIRQLMRKLYSKTVITPKNFKV